MGTVQYTRETGIRFYHSTNSKSNYAELLPSLDEVTETYGLRMPQTLAPSIGDKLIIESLNSDGTYNLGYSGSSFELQSSAFTLSELTDYALVNTASGNVDCTLFDSASGPLKIFELEKSAEANLFTITASGTDTINGQSSITLYLAKEKVRLVNIGDGNFRILDWQIPHIFLRANKLNSDQTIPNATDQNIQYDTIFDDTHSFFSSSSEFIIPRPGNYLINFQLEWAVSAVGYRYHALLINGATNGNANQVQFRAFDPNAFDTIFTKQSVVLTLGKGDTVNLRVYQTSGSDLNIIRDRTWLTMSYTGGSAI